MGKPRRDMPILDFSNPDIEDWVNNQFSKHPEIIWNGFMVRGEYSQEALKKISIFKPVDAITKPGQPIQTGGKIDWEAWFLYYNLCVLFGFSMGYKDIGVLIDRSEITVKQNFKLIMCQLKDKIINP
jgi:hypothetical protein